MPARSPGYVIRRLAISVAAGLAAAVGVAFWAGWAAAVLTGWSVFALTYSAWVLIVVWPMDAARTRTHARREAPGRTVARIIALIGSFTSLAAVAVVLIEATAAAEPRQAILAAVSVVSVMSSWLLIQVDYLLRTAATYYSDPVGGIDFNGDDDPAYTDFAYFSLGVGVAYQVSDTNVSSNAIRRLVIAQSLLGYFFGTVILATIINLVSGLG